jgi:hypothetical protein
LGGLLLSASLGLFGFLLGGEYLILKVSRPLVVGIIYQDPVHEIQGALELVVFEIVAREPEGVFSNSSLLVGFLLRFFAVGLTGRLLFVYLGIGRSARRSYHKKATDKHSRGESAYERETRPVTQVHLPSLIRNVQVFLNVFEIFLTAGQPLSVRAGLAQRVKHRIHEFLSPGLGLRLPTRLFFRPSLLFAASTLLFLPPPSLFDLPLALELRLTLSFLFDLLLEKVDHALYLSSLGRGGLQIEENTIIVNRVLVLAGVHADVRPV